MCLWLDDGITPRQSWPTKLSGRATVSHLDLKKVIYV
jgi:hypothetical protein